MLYKNVGDYLLQHVRMIVIALFNRNIFFLFFNLISTDCRPYRWGFVTTLWRLSCGAGFRRSSWNYTRYRAVIMHAFMLLLIV